MWLCSGGVGEARIAERWPGQGDQHPEQKHPTDKVAMAAQPRRAHSAIAAGRLSQLAYRNDAFPYLSARPSGFGPLLLYLHGAGEVGGDTVQQLARWPLDERPV